MEDQQASAFPRTVTAVVTVRRAAAHRARRTTADLRRWAVPWIARSAINEQQQSLTGFPPCRVKQRWREISGTRATKFRGCRPTASPPLDRGGRRRKGGEWLSRSDLSIGVVEARAVTFAVVRYEA